MRTIIAIVSDSHGGYRYGLMNPDVVLFDEDREGNPVPFRPRPTATQEYLWNLFTESTQKILELAGRDKILLLHNGDETHGNGHANELVTTRIADQVLIAASNFKSWITNPKVVAARFTIGTPVHNFKEGSSTLLVADMLAKEHKKHDVRAVNHGLLTFNQFSIDYAHHGPQPGSREWLKGNVARFYLRDLMIREIVAGNRPPDLVLRGHYHEPVIEQVRVGEHVSTIIIAPAMAIIGEYARKVTQSRHQVTNGIIALEVVDGKLLDIHQFTNTLDLRTKEEIKC